MKNIFFASHKHLKNVPFLFLLFLSSSLLAKNHETLFKEVIEKNYIIFLPDSVFDDTSEITEQYVIGDTVETYSDGMDSIYILFDDTISSDSIIEEKLFTFPTPHMLIEIGDKHLPIQPDLFGVNVTDMFEPNKATEANNAMYTVTSDPWELLAALKPKVLRFPTGSGSKYMHLLGSDNPDGTRNSGYGFKIEEIIPYYDKTDGAITITDIPFELTVLAADFAGGPGDPPGDCDGCGTWMESGDIKTFEDYYNKWDSQTPYTPTGDLETQNLAINEFIKCVKAIETANPVSTPKIRTV